MITKKIRKSEGFFWLGMGIFICLLATKTHLGSFKEPGSGFIAFAAGIFLAGVGLVMIFAAVLARTAHARSGYRDFLSTFGSVSWFRIFYTMGLLLGYAILLEPLGYILATLLIMWGLFYDWDKKNWFSSLLIALVTTGVFYVFFEKLLGLRFPAGILH